MCLNAAEERALEEAAKYVAGIESANHRNTGYNRGELVSAIRDGLNKHRCPGGAPGKAEQRRT
jgi:hypothetical protein